jgi:hypothetical protein
VQKAIQLNDRKIKHFSSVQNKAIYYADILEIKNRIMMDIGIPSFWHLDPLNINKKTPSELNNIYWKNTNVIYLKLNILEDKFSH